MTALTWEKNSVAVKIMAHLTMESSSDLLEPWFPPSPFERMMCSEAVGDQQVWSEADPCSWIPLFRQMRNNISHLRSTTARWDWLVCQGFILPQSLPMIWIFPQNEHLFPQSLSNKGETDSSVLPPAAPLAALSQCQSLSVVLGRSPQCCSRVEHPTSPCQVCCQMLRQLWSVGRRIWPFAYV